MATSSRVHWDRIDLYFADERRVPPDHADSNFRMVEFSLLSRVPMALGSIHRMRGEDPDGSAAARSYERSLPDRLDLLLLGMGSDGHTASLFPGSSAASETARRVVTSTAPVAPTERLTITAPVIRASRRCMVLVRGEDKAPAVRCALEEEWDPVACPAQYARAASWILDEAAASMLTGV